MGCIVCVRVRARAALPPVASHTAISRPSSHVGGGGDDERAKPPKGLSLALDTGRQSVDGDFRCDRFWRTVCDSEQAASRAKGARTRARHISTRGGRTDASAHELVRCVCVSECWEKSAKRIAFFCFASAFASRRNFRTLI